MAQSLETIRKYGEVSADTADLVDQARAWFDYVCRERLTESQVVGRCLDQMFSLWFEQLKKERPAK